LIGLLVATGRRMGSPRWGTVSMPSLDRAARSDDQAFLRDKLSVRFLCPLDRAARSDPQAFTPATNAPAFLCPLDRAARSDEGTDPMLGYALLMFLCPLDRAARSDGTEVQAGTLTRAEAVFLCPLDRAARSDIPALLGDDLSELVSMPS